MAQLVLKSGDVVLFDEIDEPLIRSFTWHKAKDKSTSYAKTKINGSRVPMHRLLLNLTDKKIYVDHKDRNGLNNQRDNLRICSPSDNCKNRVRRRNGTSTYKGVRLDQGRWRSAINTDGKLRYLGTFASEIEAAIAYNEAAIKSGNPFFLLNTIPDDQHTLRSSNNDPSQPG